MAPTFRLATLNVHSWFDAEGEDNFDRVKAIVKVCLLLGSVY